MILSSILGMLASKGVGLLADVLGGAADKGVDLIKEKVMDVTGIDITNEKQVANLSPEQVMELKRFEQENKHFLIDAKLRDKQMHLADVQDARDMQKTAIKKGDAFDRRFTPVLGASIIFVCLAYAAAITFIPIPPENIRFADTTLGFALATGIATILNFFFGTSQKEANKDDGKLDFDLTRFGK